MKKQYEKIVSNYTTLLEACNSDMGIAFDKLTSMILEIEAYAALTEFNLRDVKAWMHIFWRKDGRIEHIGFYLKPNSRNINIQDFKSFLSGFAMQYKFPLSSDSKYSHYSSFSFPLIYPKTASPTKQQVRKDPNGM